LTESLLESELFGHVRGAFTGAIRNKVGLLELARDGTLFLDEVGDMPLSLQAKLLRALELRQIRRVGGEADIKICARVVAATNVDLPAAIDAGKFRLDLYFRLSGFVIYLPALQERREAIPILAYEFLKRAASAFGKKVVSISPAAMSRLIHYSWPGNVRELKHAIERAVIVSTAAEIQVDDLPEKGFQNVELPGDTLDLRQSERSLILQALLESKGNRSIAARNLNIDPATLWRKLKRYNLDVPKRSRTPDPSGPLSGQ
jgi:transcriptional regulator with PAS, ATPase and Fis domain